MVHHIKEETDRIMEGTSYEEMVSLILTLMTCSKTKVYMKKMTNSNIGYCPWRIFQREQGIIFPSLVIVPK
jgi:hypothetical protein